jgi:chromosome segregation ATPase
LSARLDDQDKERAALQRSKDAVAAALEDMTSRADEHAKALALAAADRKRLQSEVKDAQARLEQERYARAEVDRSLAKAAAAGEQLRERVAAADASRVASERAHAATKGELEQTESRLAQETRERTRLETENRELLTDADQLREKIDSQLEVGRPYLAWVVSAVVPGAPAHAIRSPRVPGIVRAARAEAHAKGCAGRPASAAGGPDSRQGGNACA